jgi:hypothetical protein
VLFEEGFNDPNRLDATPAFSGSLSDPSFFGLFNGASGFQGMSGGFLAQQGPPTIAQRRRETMSATIEWKQAFDVAGSSMVDIEMTLSSTGTALMGDSFEVQFKMDNGVSWTALARFIGDGQVLRQDSNLDNRLESNAAMVAVDTTTPLKHTFSTSIDGNRLRLRLVMLFSSDSVNLAVDDVKLTASFEASVTTTVDPVSNARSSASSSKDNTGVRHGLMNTKAACLLACLYQQLFLSLIVHLAGHCRRCYWRTGAPSLGCHHGPAVAQE